MCQVLPRSPWSPVAGAVALLVALLVCAGPVQAQKAPSREPTSQESLRQFEKDLKQAEEYDPSTANLVHLFESWVVLVILAFVVAVVVIALNVVVWVIRRTSATTDPEKLALSDPWVRAQLARRQAEGGTPSVSQE
jgi:hypothetical protein